jgi:predicted RNA-binding Zn ribbon-like protein
VATTSDQATPARQAVIGRAPGRLALVQEFVNTLDVEAGTDGLSSPAALTSWLGERDLAVAAQPPATDADLRQAIAIREGLREVLLTHVRGEHPHASGLATTALAGLRLAVAALTTRLMITDDGAVFTAPAGQGSARGLAALMLIAADAAATGTWQRLKVCSADDCRWAFYDRSPTMSGCWCSMAVCGSRAKSRAFRRRAASGARRGQNHRYRSGPSWTDRRQRADQVRPARDTAAESTAS